MNFGLLKKFIVYKVVSKSKKGHGIHSPFVFDLLRNVINKKIKSQDFEFIESLRKSLLKSEKKIDVNDLGAGSVILKSNNRVISKIAKYSLKSRKYALLLYKLARHFNPENIIELGTSLGITTLYLAKSNVNTMVYTIEGCPAISEIAVKNFNSANATNISLIFGIFNNELPKLLNEVQTADFIFFDGNHRKMPTLNYFEMCLKHKTSNSVFIFDDIHLSDEMEQAWKKIKANQQVTVTIDFFYMGLVFFRNGIEKQDYVISY